MVMHGSADYQVRIETRSIMSCDQAWIPNARPDMPGSDARSSDSVGVLVCNQPHDTVHAGIRQRLSSQYIRNIKDNGVTTQTLFGPAASLQESFSITTSIKALLEGQGTLSAHVDRAECARRGHSIALIGFWVLPSCLGLDDVINKHMLGYHLSCSVYVLLRKTFRNSRGIRRQNDHEQW